MSVIGQETLPIKEIEVDLDSDRVIDPSLRALQDEKMFSIIRFNLRHGKRALAHKEGQRKAYKKKRFDDTGLEVRSYLKATPARRKAQLKDADKRYRDKTSVTDQSAARKARRHAAKAREIAAAAEALADRARF